MNKINTCVHIMYLVLVICAMYFIGIGDLLKGWFLWLVAIGMWAVLVGIEAGSKIDKNKE